MGKITEEGRKYMENEKAGNDSNSGVSSTDAKLVFSANIINAKQDSNGIFLTSFLVENENVYIPLAWIIALIIQCKGTWESLGMAFNQVVGQNSLEIAIFYMVAKSGENQFEKQLLDMINQCREAQKSKKK